MKDGATGTKKLHSSKEDKAFSLYTAYVAPRRPKKESVTESITDRPTNGPTDGHTLQDGHFFATKNTIDIAVMKETSD